MKNILIATLIGVISGLASSLFFHSLHWVTHLRLSHHFLFWGLPLGGWLTGYFQYLAVTKKFTLLF